MLIPLLLSFCTWFPAQQPTPADPSRVKAAVEALDKAFDKGTPEARLAAIDSARVVVDAAVIESLARGLERKDEGSVRAATIEALRTMRHPKAFEALFAFAKQPTTRKDQKLYASVLRAAASHGDKRAIPLLRDGALGTASFQVDEARIFGLGNIRAPESVEALIGLMNTLGPHKIEPFMNELSIALMVLTGEQGQRYDDWQRWWNENKKKLAITPELPDLPRGRLLRWHQYWGNGKEVLRKKPDDERGGEPKPPSAKG